MSTQDVARPTVAVWKDGWLPKSETFIRNQVQQITRWRPVTVGLRWNPALMDFKPDFTPYVRTTPSKIKCRIDFAVGAFGRYRRYFAQQDVRLVHAHFGYSGVRVLPLAKQAKLPLVVTFHGNDVTSMPFGSDRRSRNYRRKLPGLFAYATTLVAVSGFVADKLVELGAPREKIVVQAIGIPVRERPAPDPGRTGIVFVGRLVEKKGVADLIDAVATLPPQLLERHPVTIIGDGPLRAELEQRASSAGVAVDFVGVRPSEEVAALLASSAVFVAPSQKAPNGDSEGFGMVFLEAALERLPTIAYRHGGVTEAVLDGRTGLLANEGDVAGLAANLRQVLEDDELRHRLGEQGYRRTLDEFDIAVTTKRLETIYDNALRGRSASGELAG